MIGIYKVNQSAIVPKCQTDLSACFDIHACLTPNQLVSFNNATKYLVKCDQCIYVRPNERCLVPTGLIFDLTNSQKSMRLHARSGLSYKHGIVLANSEGIIDSDYVDELFVMIYNISYETYKIQHGDRICQAEFVNNNLYTFFEMGSPPRRLNRSGGFGSTGK